MNEADIKKPRKNKFLTIFICIFLASVAAFGATFGIIRLVKERTPIAKYDGLYLDEGGGKIPCFLL